ncbi:delta fatty acid desaturase [Micromonospora acroterricola]|uniref:Delta fatty acid desaturase n=1 Tax=Micromonospora acroterricola TaxID=2202421 RepID=A0A317CV66_9ACTN|nr:acyl-CoA desaturase [Micromonospora acroterricola]PWR05406.1 delta fatty acid desaturase [Micromonospora acroterricola]
MSDTDLGTRSDRGSEYAELSRLIRGAGLLDRQPRRYAVRVTLVLGCLGVMAVVFVRLGPSWWQTATAAGVAVLFAQLAFLGHDAGHRQIFRSRRANDVVGLVCGNLVTGISYGWWVDKHNRHHAHPNTEGHDPDIAVAPLSFTPGQAATQRGLRALFVRHQAALFFPLLMMEGLHLHAASVRAVVSRGGLRHRPAEAALLVLHNVGYFAAVFLVLTVPQAIVFILVNQALFGLYLGSSFAPNHKGMPILTEADDLDYLRRQVLTSRNVRGGRLLDALLGGLNYQIEHHLFPSMPRPNLRHAQPLIRQFCTEHGISYHETTLIQSWAQGLAHLRAVGAGATRPGND